MEDERKDRFAIRFGPPGAAAALGGGALGADGQTGDLHRLLEVSDVAAMHDERYAAAKLSDATS